MRLLLRQQKKIAFNRFKNIFFFIIFVLLLSGIGYSVLIKDTVSTFLDHDNPFNVQLNTNETFFFPMPLFGKIQNLTIMYNSSELLTQINEFDFLSDSNINQTLFINVTDPALSDTLIEDNTDLEWQVTGVRNADIRGATLYIKEQINVSASNFSIEYFITGTSRTGSPAPMNVAVCNDTTSKNIDGCGNLTVICSWNPPRDCGVGDRIIINNTITANYVKICVSIFQAGTGIILNPMFCKNSSQLTGFIGMGFGAANDFSDTYTVSYKNISFNFNSTKQQNISFYLNDELQSKADADLLKETGTIKELSYNTTIINDILNNGCNCSGCSISDSNCNVPFKINSPLSSTLTVNLTNATYTFGLDNCTNFNQSAFNFTTRSEDTNELVTSNVSFIINFFPTSNSSKSNLLISNMEERDTYNFCKFPEWTNLSANITATMRAENFETRDFNVVEQLLEGIFQGFLVPISSNVVNILYVLVDSTFARIEGATMAFFRIVNATTTKIFEGESDFQGQVVVAQDQTVTYFVNITHPDFPLKEFDLKPVLTTYTIRLLQEDDVLFQNLYNGFRYKIIPKGTLFNISNNFVMFNFTTEGSNLEFWGINLTRHNFECIPASCSNISTSSTGGTVSVAIKINGTETFFTELFFKIEEQPLVRINSYPNHGVIFSVARNSLIQFLQEIRDNTSPMTRSIFAALLTTVFVGLGSFVGLAGMPLMLMVITANIILSLPEIGLINPVFGFFITVLGMIIFGFSVSVVK